MSNWGQIKIMEAASKIVLTLYFQSIQFLFYQENASCHFIWNLSMNSQLKWVMSAVLWRTFDECRMSSHKKFWKSEFLTTTCNSNSAMLHMWLISFPVKIKIVGRSTKSEVHLLTTVNISFLWCPTGPYVPHLTAQRGLSYSCKLC